MGAKTSKEKRDRILSLREDGMSLKKIAKAVGSSYPTVQKIVKESSAAPPEPAKLEEGSVREARILRPYPNPRLVAIYFGDNRGTAERGKLVVRAGLNWRPNAKVRVRLVDRGESLYRIA